MTEPAPRIAATADALALAKAPGLELAIASHDAEMAAQMLSPDTYGALSLFRSSLHRCLTAELSGRHAADSALARAHIYARTVRPRYTTVRLE